MTNKYKYSKVNYPDICDGEKYDIEIELSELVKILYIRFEMTHEEIHGYVNIVLDEAEQELNNWTKKNGQ